MKVDVKIKFLYVLIAALVFLSGSQLTWSKSFEGEKVEVIKLWDGGGRTELRRSYENELLNAVLVASEAQFGKWALVVDSSNYNEPEDEKNLFSVGGYDLFASVNDSPLLKHSKKITIGRPIMKGLIGQRVLIIRKEDAEKFRTIKSESNMKRLAHGIPEGWPDAMLFRDNGYPVVEGGSFDDIFVRLKEKKFDYFALGANEVEEAFKLRAKSLGGLMIEPSILIEYPYSIVFYVNPKNQKLADRMENGFDVIQKNGIFDEIFDKYFSKLNRRLKLDTRKKFALENTLLSKSN